MEKFSKDYLPLEVLEDDDYFYEVMYFFYKEGVIEYIEINDIFKKFLHEDLIINFDNYIKKYDNYFENIDLRIERVLKRVLSKIITRMN